MAKQMNAEQRNCRLDRQFRIRPLVLSVRQTAVMLNVSPRLVTELIRAREIRSLKIGGRRMIPETAIVSYVSRGMERAATGG